MVGQVRLSEILITFRQSQSVTNCTIVRQQEFYMLQRLHCYAELVVTFIQQHRTPSASGRYTVV